ncbi:uncharacterized protein LOC117334642 isoform X2 [Pecten maximus]|uniref:uncharacterized protein LOC117334642 isoform X2 n=1 Tax=Pecten maximus TaxID=6579 RepID=UPI001458B75C|nr:uncharacterized protein LOC117334642 isoform X2 [Pecten maximus]
MASVNGSKISMAECMAELKAFRQVLENVQVNNREVLNKFDTRQRHQMACEENKNEIAEMKARGERLVQNLEDRDRNLENITETVRNLCGKVDGLLSDFSAIKDASRQEKRQLNTTDHASFVECVDRRVSSGRVSSDTGQKTRRNKHTSTRTLASDTGQTTRREDNRKEQTETKKNECSDEALTFPPVTVNSRGYKRRLTDDRTDNRLKSKHQPRVRTLPQSGSQSNPETVNIELGQPDPVHNLEASLALARKRAGKSKSGLPNFASKETSTMPGLDENDLKKMSGIGSSRFIGNLIFQKWYTYAETEKDIGSVSGLVRGKGPDTVLCLDTSASMEGEPFKNMMRFAMDIVTGIEALKVITEIEENVSVATIGAETKVQIHMTCDFDAVKTTLRQIHDAGPRGRSPIAGGLLVALAGCLGNGENATIGDVILTPRIVLLSDGRGTPDHLKAGPDEARDSNTDILTKTIVDSNLTDVCQNLKRRHNRVYCMPFGDADQSVLEKVSKITSGKVFLPSQLDRFLRFTDKNVAAAQLLARVVATLGYIPPGDGMRLLFERHHANVSLEDKADVLELVQLLVTELPDQLITSEHDEELPALGTRVRRGPGWKCQDQDSNGVGTVCSHGKDGRVVIEWDNGRRFFYEYKKEPKEVIPTNEHRVLKYDELIATGCRVTRGDGWSYANEDGGPGSVGVVVRVYLDGCVIIRWQNKAMSNLKYGSEGQFEVKIWTADRSTLPVRQENRSAPPGGSPYIESALPHIGEMNRRNMANQN